MSRGLPTIWMNVTTSVNWHRPPVGIVRVESSLSNELARLYGIQFKKCVWQDTKFVEWNPQLQHLDNSKLKIHNTELIRSNKKHPIPMLFPILPKRQALIALSQSVLSLMPTLFRPFFNYLLYQMKPFIVRFFFGERLRQFMAKMNWRSAKYTLIMSSDRREAADLRHLQELFSPGDVLISVGLDWDYPYYKLFYELRKRIGIKVITCCYDLIPVLYPQYCISDVAGLFTSYFLDVADGSDIILCISKQSENDLNSLLNNTGAARPLTRIITLGDTTPLMVDEEISTEVKTLFEKPFILFVSSIERRKNHEVLYRAYHLLCSQEKKEILPKLVFVGMQGWGVSELMKDIELDPLTNGLIVRLNHLNDAELRTVYEKALFCVFPSLYEGWGLPVGEALALGKVVICSDRGSLPEVGGNLVRYVDPWDAQAWADEIYKMTLDSELRSNLETKVKNEYRPRQWSDTAQTIKKEIDLIIN